MNTSSKSFSRGILEKYGWKEGQGLGREENGIATPIKPHAKSSTSGLGYKVDLTSDWWCKAFNAAAKSIEVHVSEDSVELKKNAKRPKKEKKVPRSALYSTFVKAGTQSSSGTFVPEYVEEMRSDHDEDEPMSMPKLSDEEIFKACGGLTAHRAARHGLKMSGKMRRLQEQDMKTVQQCDGYTRAVLGAEKLQKPHEEQINCKRKKHKQKSKIEQR